MYLSTYTLQSVYQWNRPCKKRYNGDMAAKLGYLQHISQPYVKLHYTHYAMDWAAKSGRLDIIKWLHKNRPEGCTKWAMAGAAENGHLEVVKWLYYNFSDSCLKYAIEIATINGHRDTVRWLCEVSKKID